MEQTSFFILQVGKAFCRKNEVNQEHTAHQKHNLNYSPGLLNPSTVPAHSLFVHSSLF